MSRSGHFSARLDPTVIQRLEHHASRAGLSKSRLAGRYLDEAMRMEDHPGIIFRDGPGGRRAGLAGGPDVWEVIAAIRASGAAGDPAAEEIGAWAGVPPAMVRAAARYHAEFPGEVDERVRRFLDEADAAEDQWRRERNALA